VDAVDSLHQLLFGPSIRLRLMALGLKALI
jgi:hypothetical protein